MNRLSYLIAAAIVSGFLALPAVAAAPKHAVIGNYFFRPGKLIIKRGTKVIWIWSSQGVVHNVTGYKGPAKFHSRSQGSGTFSFVFKRKGTYLLHCTLHPTLMSEKVVVK
jgi:plastocyanin